ncbi:MAG TPA: cytochrome c [Longimicrobium sp.]|jgi:mono/diheme cytochrome c family protein
MRRRTWWVAAVMVVMACDRIGGARKSGGGSSAPASTGQPGRPVAAAPVGVLPPGVTREAGEQGRDLYLKACVMCHGENGGGTALGPSLTDRTWIEGNGSFDEIIAVTRNGVETPKEFPVPMPPRGDGSFSDEQIRAVAAYTSSIANAR